MKLTRETPTFKVVKDENGKLSILDKEKNQEVLIPYDGIDEIIDMAILLKEEKIFFIINYIKEDFPFPSKEFLCVFSLKEKLLFSSTGKFAESYWKYKFHLSQLALEEANEKLEGYRQEKAKRKAISDISLYSKEAENLISIRLLHVLMCAMFRLDKHTKHNGIKYFGDIEKYTRKEIENVRGMGDKSFVELEAFMEKYELHFKSE